MALACVRSRALMGWQAPAVQVEVHLANGLPSLSLVGLADTEVKEARERVRSAIQNAGLEFPHNQRITVNLAPADLPKDSGRFDLPIALGILAASGQIDAQQLAHSEFAGELSLSGALRPVRGALAAALAMQQQHGHTTELVLPHDSAQEAAWVPGICVRSAQHLLDVVRALLPTQAEPLPVAQPRPVTVQPTPLDLHDVRGQAAAKRALEIAAAGGHALLMVGPPGTGKSMLAHRFAGLLPPLSVQQTLEAAAIASIAGHVDASRWGLRHTESPHHTASAVALVGGGSPPRPGAISRAHHGVLFLDELPEFARPALEALREPLETGRIHIARAAHQAEFPAQFQMIAAMNPCPCGHLGSTRCRCSGEQVARYRAKLSGPLLDRIDLHIEVPALPSQQLLEQLPSESSAQVQARVVAAHARAHERQGCTNQQLGPTELHTHLMLEPAAQALVHKAAERLGWSARATHRALKVARTIADLAGSASTGSAHVAEALQYRRGLASGSA